MRPVSVFPEFFAARYEKYQEDLQKELLVYDFTLNEGDVFEYTCDDGTKLQGKVINVKELYTTYYNPPLKAITIDFNETYDGEYGATTTSLWIEGMGNYAHPTNFVTRDTPNSWGYYTAYVINEEVTNPIVTFFTKNGMVKQTLLNDFIVLMQIIFRNNLMGLVQEQ